MKITIESQTLRAALRVVAVAAQSRFVTLPILAHVKLEARDGTLILSKTDLDLFVTETVEATVKQDGATTAPLALLAQLCERITSQQITLETQEALLVVRGGDVRATLDTLPAEEFPPFPEVDGKRVGCDAAELLTPFRKLAHAIGKDRSRYQMMGVNISPNKGHGSIFAASNGNKLAVFQGESRLTDSDVTLPDIFVRAFLKLQPEGAATVSVAGDTINVSTNGTRISSKLIEGHFPNWRTVMPEAGPKVFSCARKDLTDAIQTCALLASPELPGVRLTGRGKELEVESVREAKTAKARVLGTDLAGQPDLAMQFNARSMLDTLNVLDGDEVRIACTDEREAMLIQEGAFKAVIMPIYTK